MMLRTTTIATACAGALLLGSCASGGQGVDTVAAAPGVARVGLGVAAAPVPTSEADWAGVAKALGRAGKLMDGTVYRVGFPRRDLKVRSHGVTVAPGLSLGGYAAFAKYGDGSTLMMGDLVVTEAELPKVTDALQAAGLEQTAVHKHLLTQTPAVWWTHFHGHGNAVTLARKLHKVLAATATPPAVTPPAAGSVDLDTKGIDAALGRAGTLDGGIYKFTIARAETITDGAMVLPSGMGVTTALGFQPLGHGRAAVNGDIVMTAAEVQKVIAALREHHIDLVEVHSHTLTESPRLFYAHFWAVGRAVTLAKGLAAAVAQTDAKPAT